MAEVENGGKTWTCGTCWVGLTEIKQKKILLELPVTPRDLTSCIKRFDWEPQILCRGPSAFQKLNSSNCYSLHWKTGRCKYMSRKTIAFSAMIMQSLNVFSGRTITYKITWSLSKPLGTVFLKKLSARKKTLSHKYLACIQKSRMFLCSASNKGNRRRLHAGWEIFSS